MSRAALTGGTGNAFLEAVTQSQVAKSQQGPVRVAAGGVTLEGDLTLPDGSRAIVVFAHGSGTSRHGRRNRRLAEELNRVTVATLLLDLLTPDEQELDQLTAHLRSDVGLLASRLVAAADWLAARPDTRSLGLGYCGSNTGAAATLIAAAERPAATGAVVSRGGRLDLASAALERVRAATLLIVGAFDFPFIELNQTAFLRLYCEKDLVLVPGATHLLEEPGAPEEVTRLARQWFQRHLLGKPSI